MKPAKIAVGLEWLCKHVLQTFAPAEAWELEEPHSHKLLHGNIELVVR
jgi:hypothetical protein